MPTLFGGKKRSFENPKNLGISTLPSSPPRLPIKLVVRGGGGGAGGQQGPSADAPPPTGPADKAKAGKARLDSSSDDSDSNDRRASAAKPNTTMPSAKAKMVDESPPKSPEEIQITIKGAATGSQQGSGSGYGNGAFSDGSRPRIGARRLSQKSSTATLTPDGGAGGGKEDPPPPMPSKPVSGKTAKMLGLDDAGPSTATQARQQRGAMATAGQTQTQRRRSIEIGRGHSRNGSSETNSNSVTPTRATFAGGRITPPPLPPSFVRTNSIGLSPTSTFNRADYFAPPPAMTTPGQPTVARQGVSTSRTSPLPRSGSSKAPIAHRAGVVLDGISPGTEAPTWASTSTFVSGSIPAPQAGAFAPASAWPLGDGTATTPLGRGIDEQTKAFKKPSAEISPFLFQSEDGFTSMSPVGAARGPAAERGHGSMASDMTQQGSSARGLRGAKSVGTLNGGEASPPAEDGPSPTKKRSLFGMLKKKASRSELADGEDSPSRTRTNKQASWDAFVEGQDASGGGKIGRIRKLGSKDRTGRNVSDGGGIDRKLGKYGLDEDITLDTNLDSMEGIIDLNSQFVGRRDSSTSGASAASKDGTSSSIHASTSNLRWRAGSETIPQGTFFVDPFNGRALPPGRQQGQNENEALMPGSALAHRSISGSRKGSVQAGGVRDLRRGSFLSVHSTSSTSGTEAPSNVRRPSLAGASAAIMAQQNDSAAKKQPNYTPPSNAAVSGASAPPAVPPPVGPAGIQAASGSAAWTAPESWAVKGDGNGDEAADTEESDEEANEIVENVAPSRPGTAVPRPPPALDAIKEGEFGVKDGSTGKASTQSSDYSEALPLLKPVGVGRRPGTGTKVTPADMSKTWTIRIYRPDGTFVTLLTPLLATTDNLYGQLLKKMPNQKTTALQLLIRERGLERVMASSDKPIIIQRRRLEQAGYTEADKLDDVGRSDYSYLIKFMYRDEALTTSVVDRDEFDSYEHVNLQARSLQAIPIFLFRHASAIVGLNLSRNPKLDLPSDFVALCLHLRELRLCYMAMKRIPQSISRCVSLTYLDVSNNRIVDLEHASLDNLKMLTDLKAHNNRIYTLPAYFSTLSSLRFINLSNNKFETLPEVLCDMPALVDLDISFNTISTLPPAIGQLTKLERLVLLANPISALPTTFSGLKSLRELDCRRCQLADIAVFSALPELKTLLCDNNSATVLDGEFKNLHTVSACRNSITRLQLTGTASTLVSLTVSHAKVSSLGSEFFEGLGACEILVLDNNQIKSLADSFSHMTNLRKLSIRNNHLDSLPTSIGELQRLHTVDVANNNIKMIPASIWNCAQLIVLNVTANLISEFPLPQAVEATTTDEMGRKMSIWSKGAGRAPPPLCDSLQELFMGDNKLGDNVFSPLSLLNELRVLNLSFNELYEIPALTLSKCVSLEELYLSGNSLTSLPGEDFERLVNLKTLFLNGNKLHTLPAELGKLKFLEALDIASNLLKYNVTNWPYDWNWNWNLELQYLNFSGNKRLEIKPMAGGAQPDAVLAAKRRNLSNFNALRKLRMLGLMDVTLTTTVLPDENEDRRVRSTQSEIGAMGYGIADSMGREDHNVVGLDMVVPRFRNKDDESLFGLFDSHAKTPFGGAHLAKFLQDSFPGSLSVELKRTKDTEGVGEALRRAFLNVNRDYGNSISHLFDGRRKGSDASSMMLDRAIGGTDVRCGASAVIMYVQRKTVHVANVGDALAFIAGRGGKARPLSSKHEPFDTQEIERIRTAEGWVSQKGLVADDVEVSRSFGYYHLHPAINARPSVQSVALTEDDEFIIVANASLWAHMTYQVAVDTARAVAREAALAAGDPFMKAAQKLRDLALSYGAESNLMVMVIGVGDLFKAKRPLTYRGAGGVMVDEEAYGATRVAARRGHVLEAPGEKYLTLLDREVAPPTGMVALVFTDIRNSTSLWETNGGMQSAMRMHNQLLRRQLRAIGGYEVKTEGDAFMVSFPTVTSALLWCLTVQLELLREDWPQEILHSEDGKEIFDSLGQLCYRGLSVRMGIHWGKPYCETDPITRRMDYMGPMVNKSSRISAEAKGGEIAVSSDVVEIVKKLCFDKEDRAEEEEDAEGPVDLDPGMQRDVSAIRKLGFGVFEIGERRLKGLETPELISLIYPRALAGRLNGYGASLGGADGKMDEVYEPTPRMIDVDHIRQLAVLVMRLEAVSAANVHAPLAFDGSESTGSPSTHSKLRLHPHLLAYPIRLESTDEELAAVLENQVIRLENVLSSLQIRALGPVADILAALGDAISPRQRDIFKALRA